MKKNRLILATLLLLSFTWSAAQTVMKSPDGRIGVKMEVNSSKVLTYQIEVNNKLVLEPSVLGLVRADADFSALQLVKMGVRRSVKQRYNTPAEKRVHNVVDANEWDLLLKNPTGQPLTITFHVSNRGVAFRYVFAGQSTTEKVILKENSSFKLPLNAKAWLHPHDDVKNCWAGTCPSYEDNYLTNLSVGTEAPKKAGWSFPALFKSNGAWLLISEADLQPSYCGTRLAQKSPQGEYFIEFPQVGESMKPTDPVTPHAKTPFKSPWRVIMVGDLADIVENSLITDLAQPTKQKELDFIKPGIAAWSWGGEKDNSVNYERQIDYIDYAARMNWEYVLVDASWDTRIGNERIQKLVDYAKNKHVRILLWYNSSGDWNTTEYSPKSALIEREARRKEFQRISKMGIAGVKVDFFPGDAPSAIQYYHDILQDAGEAKLLVNFHGATVPRGWSRTYPHLMTMEAVKGFEFITFSQETADLAPEQCAMLPFARNVVGPMDFTPMFFGEIPNIIRRTSNAFELALSVLFQSGIQHYVEIPESMAKQPNYVQSFLKNIPRTWDDIRFLSGIPAKYVVIARKSGNNWYIAGINATKETQVITLKLGSLQCAPVGTLITDGDTNRSFSTKEVTLNQGSVTVEMKPNGGFVISFLPIVFQNGK